MAAALRITSTSYDARLLDLPWHIPLKDWPAEIAASLPRGISRHTVRFIYLGSKVIAIKEIGEHRAYHEFHMLQGLGKLDAPSVAPLAVVDGRVSHEGEQLAAALVTEHLSFSLPYRALFGLHQRMETVNKLIDALSVLLVRLHLLGFFWGDVSLSNTLFRRDAGAFAAYLVDAETGELQDGLTNGKREYDIEVARVNIIGELMDLQAAGKLPDDFDTVAVGDRLSSRYTELWDALTSEMSFPIDQRWKLDEHIARLNEMGFDVGEFEMTTDETGHRVRVIPRIVDAGHFRHRVHKLTGMDVHENQARRLMADIEQYRVATGRQDEPLETVAEEWLHNSFEPTVKAIPRALKGKLEPAELYHQYLDHRWYISERSGHDVPRAQAITSFINTVLQHQRDEQSFIEPPDPDSIPTAATPGLFSAFTAATPEHEE